MGLYISEEKHHGIYKNTEQLDEPNQVIFRRDHVSEVLKEQHRNNHMLQESIIELKRSSEQQMNRQIIQLQATIENERVLEQKMMDQLEQFKLSNQALAKQITKQKDAYEAVINRLENQEALMEKALRQINHLRLILFERTNFLAEKVEDSFKLTSTYVYQLMKGSDQSLTLYLPKPKQKKK